MGTMTRSRIEAFDRTANGLSQSAARWRVVAAHWEEAATAYVSQVATPGGTDWRGRAADSAFDRAHADQQVVLRATGHALEMAGTAEQGSNCLIGARASALEAIAEAEEEGFAVGEDLSVSDIHSRTAAERAVRRPVALEHAGYIIHCAGRLEAQNESVAAKLRAGALQMTSMTPAHWQPRSDPLVQEAGYGISPLPSGPITWCLRPGGTSGKFRCSVLYPDGSVSGYWSFTDDSGGSLP
jgi:hypothetical protein